MQNQEVLGFLISGKKELKEGFLNGITGTYKPPSGYFINEEEAEKFDAQFPPKEKRKLSSQLF